jgi:hypothetical protein
MKLKLCLQIPFNHTGYTGIYIVHCMLATSADKATAMVMDVAAGFILMEHCSSTVPGPVR